jgi:hypothetical protein
MPGTAVECPRTAVLDHHGVEEVEADESPKKTVDDVTSPQKRDQSADKDNNETAGAKEPAKATPRKTPKRETVDLESGPATKLLKTEHGIKGSRNRGGVRKSGQADSEVAESLDMFTETYASVATKALEIQASIAKDKGDRDLKLAQDKADRDLKILELTLKYGAQNRND